MILPEPSLHLFPFLDVRGEPAQGLGGNYAKVHGECNRVGVFSGHDMGLARL